MEDIEKKLKDAYGVVPPSGEFGTKWPNYFNLPAGASGELSTGGWTLDNLDSGNFGNEGFIQQTFLGASIQNFNISAGFGDTTSTLSLQLVNDEYNLSDHTREGFGDDPYHSGAWLEANNEDLLGKGGDFFRPPVVGTPVFFKFGKNPATTEQAYRQTYDDLYGIRTLPKKDPKITRNAFGYDFPIYGPFGKDYPFDELPLYHGVDRDKGLIEDRSILWDLDNPIRGRNHFVFGGILQSYTQNRSQAGSPLYSVNVNDPREILASVDVLLNNYQDTTFNYKNIINLYGFLEYDPSPQMLEYLKSKSKQAGIVRKFTDRVNGAVQYRGITSYWDSTTGWENPDYPTPQNIAIQKTDSYEWTPKQNENENLPRLETVNFPSRDVELLDQYYFGKNSFNDNALPEYFPITGQGFSRRSDKGMPWYRISQGLSAIFQYYGFLPRVPTEQYSEFATAGFGGQINFRGYNYVVDFGGIPTDKIPLLYYMDFDRIDLLSLAQELCDIISHDLYVTLLPIIDHPASEFLHEYNEEVTRKALNKQPPEAPANLVAGIIRLDAIDKSKQPKYGAIKSYLETLDERGIEVENQDVGYELSNVTTDKFVVGAQEVDMYMFSTHRDRDELFESEGDVKNLELINQKQWDLTFQEQQQVIPYYGLLGKNAVSIPRGFGPFQQILLDATELNANGVGNYYVATELELRAALVSYKSWKNFLLSYNDVYIEDISEHSALFSALAAENNQVNRALQKFYDKSGFEGLEVDDVGKELVRDMLTSLENRKFAVTVPRSVFHSDRPYMIPVGEGQEGGGYPASPCSPPLGYPLYYKRATRIGIVEAGIGKVIDAKTRIVTGKEKLKQEMENLNNPLMKFPRKGRNARIQRLEKKLKDLNKQSEEDPKIKKSDYYKNLVKSIEDAKKVEAVFDAIGAAGTDLIAEVEDIGDPSKGPMAKFLANLEKTAKKHEENAKKVYEFVKKVAEENLGKKFLVRIPKACNPNFSSIITTHEGSTAVDNFKSGPFGFAPRPINSDYTYVDSQAFKEKLQRARRESAFSLFNQFLEDYTVPWNPNSTRIKIGDNVDEGALKGNYNPFSEQWEFNYQPEPQGGYMTFEQFGVNISPLEYFNENIRWNQLPPAIQNGLVPIDQTNLTNDQGRLQCYAKYNNSQILDFTAVQTSDMVQQTLTEGGQFIPDVIESLQNNSVDKKESFEAIDSVNKDQRLVEKPPNSMAFVKCQVEEKLYLPPQLKQYNLDVFGNEYDLQMSVPEPEIVDSTYDEQCNKIPVLKYPKIIPVFTLPDDGGVDGTNVPWIDYKRRFDKGANGLIIETETEFLDDEHVYALVTVPGRVKSTADVRWKDGPQQAYNTVAQKHLMMQDVVNIPEFNKPNIPLPAETKLPCGPAPIYEPEGGILSIQGWKDAYNKALESANEFGLPAVAHLRPDQQDWKNYENGGALPNPGWSPGRREDWLKLTLEQVSSARQNTKTILKGFALGQPAVNLGYTSPSPIIPDMIAIPLMSKERCYGPWLSASALEDGSRIRYSNIGGKVEFVKDENLAPWKFAGYQLMNEAGALQANFSNSLLLFSERGGFVMPDAPTGIALASALKEGGPLITSLSIDVGQGGVKTTIKMDLYTSQFGKLQKQKEMAISQVARERQKSLDDRNASIRRGIGKATTSADLVNQVMQNGGSYITSIANGINTQQEAYRELGQELGNQVLIVGPKGETEMMDIQDAQRKMEVMDPNSLTKAATNTAMVPPGQDKKAYHNNPTQGMPSRQPSQSRAMNDRTNSANHRQG